MRVLIAEDEVTSRIVLTTVLTHWGYEVVAANDGGQAWNLLQEHNAPKLLILDWMMPGMDGVDICRKIRENSKNDPSYIILLTCLGRKEAHPVLAYFPW